MEMHTVADRRAARSCKAATEEGSGSRPPLYQNPRGLFSRLIDRCAVVGSLGLLAEPPCQTPCARSCIAFR
jgi:hypothetical protein